MARLEIGPASFVENIVMRFLTEKNLGSKVNKTGAVVKITDVYVCKVGSIRGSNCSFLAVSMKKSYHCAW